MDINYTSEELLDAWLGISATISNDRIVEGLTFNEAFVCNILSKERKNDNINASQLCTKTGIQKSQMNKVLNSLEKKGLVIRERSISDKRNVHIFLNMDNINIYEKSHQKSISVVKSIIEKIGIDKASELASLLNEVNSCFSKINKKLYK